MFDILRKRISKLIDTRTCSFEDLDQLDIDSVDSICLTEVSTATDYTIASNVDISSYSMEEMNKAAKCKVSKILRSIKKLEKLHQLQNSKKMNMLAFMDVICDQQYSHVSMNLMSDFIKISKMVPKSYYLHYYIFFLYYALYYHNHRAYVDVIDKSRKTNHINRMLSIKCQLKYLQYKIKQSRNQISVDNERE